MATSAIPALMQLNAAVIKMVDVAVNHAFCRAHLSVVRKDFIRQYGRIPLEEMWGIRLSAGYIEIGFPVHPEVYYCAKDCCLWAAKADAIAQLERLLMRLMV